MWPNGQTDDQRLLGRDVTGMDGAYPTETDDVLASELDRPVGCQRLIDERFNGWGCSTDPLRACHNVQETRKRGMHLYNPDSWFNSAPRWDAAQGAWLAYDLGAPKPRNPRHFEAIEGGRKFVRHFL